MRRWNTTKDAYEESDPKIDAFLRDINAVYVKHGLAIGHEDGHGSFEIVKLDAYHVLWLQAANDCRSE